MNTMHHSMAALSVAPDRPEGAARRTPPPGVRTAAALTLLISMMTAAGPTLANVGCPPGSSAPDCAAPQSDSALTASFHGAPAAHNGKKLFAFEIRFSQSFDALRLGAFKKALSVTGGRVVDVKRTVRGQNGAVTVRVRPNSSGALTVTLAATTAGGGSLTVPGPSTPPPSPPPVSPPPVSPPVTETSTIDTSTTDTPATETPATDTSAPLTAAFHGVPDEHDGKKLFSFEIRFSEEFRGMRLTALKQALQVTGGRVIDVKRTVRGQNRKVTVRVRPSSHDPVTVALGATTDCAAAGAVCAADGRKLSGSLSASVTSPAWGPGPSIGQPASAQYLRSLSVNLPVVKDVERTDPKTSAPAGFPTSDAGTVVNMNAMGSSWSGKPNIQLRERFDSGGQHVIDFPCINPDTNLNNVCRIGGHIEKTGSVPAVTYWAGGLDAYGRWFSYPHDAGTNDMKVHLLVRRTTYGVENGGAADSDKADLSNFFKHGHDIEWFYKYKDFFTAEAHLEAPGSGVQPNVGQNSSLTWSGKVIGLDTAKYGDASKNPNFGRRGDLIGGDATITVSRATSNIQRATVSLTNLTGANVLFSTYPDLSWSNIQVDTNGNFSGSNAGTSHTIKGTVSGTFRGTGAAKVGGTFEIPNHWRWQAGRWLGMVGGFVADKQ